MNRAVSRDGGGTGRRPLAGALTFVGLALVAATKLASTVVAPGLAPADASSEVELDAEPLAALPREGFAYTLEADLDPVAHTIAGRGTIDFTNTSRAPVSELWFHLYLNAFEGPETVFQRGPRGGFRGSGRVDERGSILVRRLTVPAWGGADLWPHGANTPGEPSDHTDIRVPLPRPIAPGELVRLDVAWDSKLPPVTLRTGYAGSFHMAGQWFPKIAKLEPDGSFAHFPFERLSEFYADFADWDVTVRAPSGVIVGATGAVVDERDDGDHVARRFVQKGVHDFAFAAWDGFVETRAEHDGVALRVLAPRGYERAATLELETAKRGLDVLGARYGRYPHGTLTLVHPPASAPEAGGMEYPTLITTGGPWWGPALGVRTAELVTIHELAHQWFQGLVATNEREFPFLDEGLTTFAEIDAMDELAPGSSATRAFGLSVGTHGFYRSRAADTARFGVVARPARDFTLGSDYGDLVYGRTATLLRTLDRVYPGQMRRALGVYARRFRFGHPTPDDLLGVVRERMGEGAAEALRSGLFERGTVDFAVRGVTSRVLPDGRVGVDVEVGRAGAIVLPVEVDVVGDTGDVQRLTWEGGGAATTLHAELDGAVRAVVVDPERRVLCDDDLFNATWSAEPGPLAGRTLGAASFAVRAALAAVGP